MNSEQIAHYLKRIDYSKEIRKDTETLSGLIIAHLEQVPFENLDVFDFDRIPELSEAALFQKIVEERRGGFCFELNRLFYYLLESIGFSVYPVAARILWNKETPPPLGHMALIVQLDGKDYLCDVGYGGPGPKGLMCLEEAVQKVQDVSFRFDFTNEEILLERFHHKVWKPVFAFSRRPFPLVDFELLSYYAASSANMVFKRMRILNICTPSGSKALTGMELKVVSDGSSQVTEYKTQKELEEGIEREFGISSEIWN